MLRMLILIFLISTASQAMGVYDEGMQVVDVAIIDNNMHIQFSRRPLGCQDGTQWYRWHAYIGMDTPFASKYMAMALSAKNSGDKVHVWGESAAKNCNNFPFLLSGLGVMPQ